VLPLLLGVTGHRDLRAEDVLQLEARVREVFDEVQRQTPHMPLLVVSALAEGADRLVARIALERGHRLVAPLPMPPEVYETDFATQESREEFHALLARADPWFVVSEGRVQIPPEDRARGYALVGAYLAQSCQILVALWDGMVTGKAGGTSAVVSFVREGVPSDLDALLNGKGTLAGVGDLDEPEGCGVIYHIPTPHASHPELPAGPPLLVTRFYPRSVLGDEAIAKRFDRIVASLDELNADLKALGTRLPVDPERRAGRFLKVDEERTLPVGLLFLRDQYVLADALSLYFQDRTKNARFVLLLLVFLAVLIFGLYAHVTPLPALVFLYLGVIALAYFFWFLFAGRGVDGSSSSWTTWLLSRVLPQRLQGNYQHKYLDYRAIAEASRVQFYWALAGLPDHVEDHYLRQHRTELDWIRVALRIARLLRDDFRILLPPSVPSGGRIRLEQTLAHWVEGQQRFFTRAALRDEKRLIHSEHTVHFLLGLGIVLALVLVGLSHEVGESLHGFLVLAAVLAPAGAGVVHYQAERRALSEQKKRYERMSVLYRIASDRVSKLLEAGREEHARLLFRALGLEALFENAGWVLLHRDRPVVVPHV
jgi:hypothetical protein